MVTPSRFFRRRLPSVCNRGQLDIDYIKLPADTDDEGRQPQEWKRSGPFLRVRLFVGWESSDQAPDGAWNYDSSGNIPSKSFGDVLRKLQLHGRDTLGEYYRSLVPSKDLAASSNAPEENHPHRSFRIIHPFHPLTNREFELVIYRHNWGEDRVYFHDPDGKLSAIPASWTDLIAEDPFVGIAAGRSLFRLDDLLKLSEFIAAVQR